jgi:hypothetical protein
MSGGPKFSSVTRIGNWFEELAMDEAKSSNFEKRSNNGKLSLRKLEGKVTSCSVIVPHSFSPDGFIRFGDEIMLQHDSSGSILSCDPFEAVEVGQEKYLITTVAEHPLPKARSVFRIVRPPKHLCGIEDNLKDDILRVGQSFLLGCNDALLVTPNTSILAPPLYLASTKKNERTSTKRTNRQMVYLSSALDSDAVWTAIIPSKGT